MAQQYDIAAMVRKIETIKQTAEELKSLAQGIQTVQCNTARILAAVRVLELDIADVEGIY